MLVSRTLYAPLYFLTFVDMRVGPLAYLWAVAPVHRHHHLASATQGDVNFGLFFTIWYVLLGTARFRSCYQIRAEQVGIAGRADFPETYLAQLAEPFRGTLSEASLSPSQTDGRR